VRQLDTARHDALRRAETFGYSPWGLITDAQASREHVGKREALVVRLELDHGAEVLVLEGR